MKINDTKRTMALVYCFDPPAPPPKAINVKKIHLLGQTMMKHTQVLIPGQSDRDINDLAPENSHFIPINTGKMIEIYQ